MSLFYCVLDDFGKSVSAFTKEEENFEKQGEKLREIVV
jgi:hypothetical protein